jgi:hypothetical protein
MTYELMFRSGTAIVIKRILSSPNIPPEARRKVEEYVEQKISGLYGHNEEQTRAFRDKLRTRTATPRLNRPLQIGDNRVEGPKG